MLKRGLCSTAIGLRLSQQRGLSLVEMMVGIAVGLFIVAAATALAGGQLGDTRRLITETQVQQDLRSTADIVVRELRRAGYSAGAEAYIWGDGTGDSQPNGKIAITTNASSTIFEYDRATNEVGPFGFKLNNGTVQILFGTNNWQDLTDSRVMNVTAFSITQRVVSSSKLPCARNCADGTTDCWPSISVREYDVSITGQSRTDSNVTRTVTSTTRLRNDAINYNIAAAPTQLCPT